MAILIKVYQSERPERPTSVECGGQALPARTWSFIQECWAQEADARPTIDGVLDYLRPSTPAKFLFRGQSHSPLIRSPSHSKSRSSSLGLSLNFAYSTPTTAITFPEGDAKAPTQRVDIPTVAARTTRTRTRTQSSDQTLASSSTSSATVTVTSPLTSTSVRHKSPPSVGSSSIGAESLRWSPATLWPGHFSADLRDRHRHAFALTDLDENSEMAAITASPQEDEEHSCFETWGSRPRRSVYDFYPDRVVDPTHTHTRYLGNEDMSPPPPSLPSPLVVGERPFGYGSRSGSMQRLGSIQRLNAIQRRSSSGTSGDISTDDVQSIVSPVRPRLRSPAPASLEELFKDTNTSTTILDKLKRYEKMARMAQASSMDARELVPTRFVFKEPPGTRNTSVVHRLARLYFDLGLVGLPDVFECSMSNLIGVDKGQVSRGAWFVHCSHHFDVNPH
jgi:hypothetical protein